MKTSNIFLSTLLILSLLSADLSGGDDNTLLTLEDIYRNNTYRTLNFQSVRWMNDHEHYSTLELSVTGRSIDIIRYNARTGERFVLVEGGKLIPKGSAKPLIISDYSWSQNNDKILIFTNTRRVWRDETRGDYWVLDVETGALEQMGKSLGSASLMFAKFSPDGSRVAYVSRNNIYVESSGSGDLLQLTTDGDDRIVNGTFDWVYEEEFDCQDGFRWSNDGSHIAFWHSDTEGTGTFYLINNLDSVYSQPVPFPYPKVGTTNSAVKIGVIPSTGGQTRWFDIPGDPRNNYLVRMDFIPGSDEVMIQQVNRLQNSNQVWVGNVRSMELENILTESDEAFLDVHDNVKWMDDSKYFTWTSERNGWRHLYMVSRDGFEVRPVTKGEFDVVQINCIDPESGYVYYIASPDNYTQRYLYRSRLDGKGEAERITPDDLAGQHTYNMSGNAEWAIHTYESAVTPPVISLIRLKRHKALNVLEDNSEIMEKFQQVSSNPKEFFRVDIGEVILDAWMIKPADFNPQKRYPVIFFLYGEPASSTVQDRWSGGDLWHQYMARKGYVIISVDNRGTKVPRGRDWRKSIYRQIGVLAADDQAEAARTILETYSYIDPNRVGMWGWSGGGSMTVNCMFRYPSIYKTGIAIAVVAHQKLYDTAYQERYMGLPADNPKGYFEGSPINHASGLQGNLLLIHGTADDNVHYQNFEMLVDELIRQDKLFDMMSYPMRKHSIRERANTDLHLRRTMEKFWEENL